MLVTKWLSRQIAVQGWQPEFALRNSQRREPTPELLPSNIYMYVGFFFVFFCWYVCMGWVVLQCAYMREPVYTRAEAGVNREPSLHLILITMVVYRCQVQD